jgi:phosphopantothenoylcysteine synthetase/decarboxylase
MGFAIAERLADLGAKVYLVCGPVSLKTSNKNIERIDVTSALEMFDACKSLFERCNGAIMSAAVADYTPVIVEKQKIKRASENYTIELKPNPDIAATLGRIKRNNQVLVGFALETQDEEQNAVLKLKKKNLDFIVLNSLRDEGSGFQVDTNKIKIIDNKGNIFHYRLKPKNEVAADIIDKLIETEKALSTLD